MLLPRSLKEKNYANCNEYENNVLELSKINELHVNFIWEVLYGCSEKCPGCYVNKFDNDIISEVNKSIDHVYDIIKSYKVKPYEKFKEILLGPTDITNCLNIDDLIKNEKFRYVVDQFELITVTGSFLSPLSHIQKFISWKNKYFPSHEVEYLITINKNELENDSYIKALSDNLLHINDNILGDFEYTFIFNMKTEGISEDDYVFIKNKVRDEFGVILELNPSFYRTQSRSFIGQVLTAFNKSFNSFKKPEDIMLVHTNLPHAELSYKNILIKGSKKYIMPFLFENCVLLSDDLLVDDDLNQCNDTNIIQINYLKEIKNEECLNCEFLYNCLNRNVISIMKNYDFTQCIAPKKLMTDNRLRVGVNHEI